MDRNSKIFVAGHSGLVGSAVVRCLRKAGYTTVLQRAHRELDLCDRAAVTAFLAAERPRCVVIAAAKVGGIAANNTYPADFIYQNLQIQTNVIHESWRHGVERLVFLGSSCIYPRDCPQPIREEYLLTGPLEKTNRAYALAKIAGIEMCRSYNLQYGTQYVCAMPTNLYGIGDNYDLEKSHVLPALIRKAHEAKVHGASSVTAWGSGRPRRELMSSDDLAEAIVLLMTIPWARILEHSPDGLPLFNIGTGEDLSIAEIAKLTCEVVGFHGRIAWDAHRPDGTPQKLLDVSRIEALGWRSSTGLKQGIGISYADFLSRIAAGCTTS